MHGTLHDVWQRQRTIQVLQLCGTSPHHVPLTGLVSIYPSIYPSICSDITPQKAFRNRLRRLAIGSEHNTGTISLQIQFSRT